LKEENYHQVITTMNKNHKLIYASSYDRGLVHLLEMWPKIKERFSDATLDIYYGWNLFTTVYANNPERMLWKDKIDKLMSQGGIKEHGRVGKKELDEATYECGIWAYPAEFREINCITALNCQKLGCVPVVINLAALDETVGCGVKVSGDIYDSETKEEYLKQLISLMGDEKRWEEESKKGVEFAKQYSWDKISNLWVDVFNEK